jgi:hypothetical protein
VAVPIIVVKREARELRQAAAQACAHARWDECLTDLDEADRKDPSGANDPAVRELRDGAKNGVAAPRPGGDK